MPVIFIAENDQTKNINGYNQGKPGHRRIPLVPRNLNTGWPLMQVSLFTAAEITGETRYEPVLGGGRCHYFDMGLFMLASLLSKVPGKVQMVAAGMHTDSVQVPRDKINADNITAFISNFSFSHGVGIALSASHGPYGLIIKTSWKGEENEELHSIENYAYDFAISPGKHIANFGTYKKNEKIYTIEEINNALNHRVAIFKNGQIFVDLGMLLDSEKDGRELKDFFNNIFKVDEFNGLYPKWSNPNLKKLYARIDELDNYGDEIGATTTKGAAIKILALKLRGSVNDFYEAAQAKKPTKDDLINFNREFKELLHSEDKIMKTHRNIYNPIILNILLAAIGVGLILIPLRAVTNVIYSKIKNEEITINGSLFFAKTKSSQKIEAVEDCLLENNLVAYQPGII